MYTYTATTLRKVKISRKTTEEVEEEGGLDHWQPMPALKISSLKLFNQDVQFKLVPDQLWTKPISSLTVIYNKNINTCSHVLS